MHDRKDGAMTATDELRRLLDERGVEHTDASYKRKVPITVWCSGDATFCFVDDVGQADLHIENPTPEQAIAATLGTPERTCHIEERYIDWYCDACFKMVGTCDTISELFIDGNAIKLWNYCPNCGARVERNDDDSDR